MFSRCIICNGNTLIKKLTACDPDNHTSYYNLLFCKKCFIGYTDPLPDNFEKHYDFESYYGYKKGKEGRYLKILEKIFYDLRRNTIRKIKAKGDVLEVGCGSGGFLASLKKYYCVTGIEKSKVGCKIARDNFDLDIFNGDITDYKNNKEFDVIIFWHSFEHMSNPVEVLERIRSLLNRDGVLVMSIPNLAGFEFKFFKGNWFHLDMPRHAIHYSYNAIIQLCERLGFESFRSNFFSLEYDFASICQSILNQLGFKPNFLKYKLKYNKSNKGGESVLCFSIFLLGILIMPIIMIAVLGGVFKKSGTATLCFKLKT